MFKKLFKKINILFLVALFSCQILFAGKSLTTLFRKYNIFYVKTLSRGHEKIVFKVVINGRELACLWFIPNPKKPGKNKYKFEKELNFLDKHEHKNIVRKVGYLSEDEHYCIFMELADCDLEDCIFLENESISFKQKIKILRDIISGVDYMHSSLDLVHVDLKLANVIIFQNEEGDITAKLIDFTYSKPEGVYRSGEGTLKFSSPEYLLPSLEYFSGESKYMEIIVTKKNDIFSFAAIIYKMFYKKNLDTDFKNCLISDGCQKSKLKLVFGIEEFADYTSMYIKWLNQGERPLLDDELVDPRINSLIQRCWDTDPENRPDTYQILEELEGIQEELFL